jgi:hypothetical protein
VQRRWEERGGKDNVAPARQHGIVQTPGRTSRLLGRRPAARTAPGEIRRFDSNATIMPMKTGYLIDMDGVIYRENQLIPGAADFVAALATSTPFLSSPTTRPTGTHGSPQTPRVSGLNPKHFTL